MSIHKKYDPVAITLHWVSAACVLALFGMGWVMTNITPGSLEQFKLYQGHKSVGITVLILTALRLVWRVVHPAPALPSSMAVWEKRVAQVTHIMLYGFLLAMPLIGWAVVSTSAFNIPTLLYGTIPLPHLAFLADSPDKAQLNKVMEVLHGLGSNLLLLLLFGHVGAALRHHFILQDGILRRMVPFMALVGVIVATPAVASEWTLDAPKSRLGFEGNQSGVTFEGHFTKWSAHIDFDPANPAAAHALISIDMTSAVTGDAQKDSSLPQGDWFDSGHFPTATFEAKGFKSKDKNTYEALGTLTIKGHGKEVVLPFSLEIAGDTAHAKGRLSLVRTDYGVGMGAWSTAQYVGLDVAVTFDLMANRKN